MHSSTDGLGSSSWGQLTGCNIGFVMGRICRDSADPDRVIPTWTAAERLFVILKCIWKDSKMFDRPHSTQGMAWLGRNGGPETW